MFSDDRLSEQRMIGPIDFCYDVLQADNIPSLVKCTATSLRTFAQPAKYLLMSTKSVFAWHCALHVLMKTGAHFVRGISVAESEILIIILQMTTWNWNMKISLEPKLHRN
jgi:hypothetical protein